MKEVGQNGKVAFSMQAKLLLLIFFISFFVFAVSAYGLIAVNRITVAADAVINREGPLVRSIQEALTTMLVGRLAVEQAIDITDVSRVSEVAALEETFIESIPMFNAFVAAITWGSDTPAFARSEDGKNYQTWRELGLIDTFIVPQPSALQVQLAAEAGLYYRAAMDHAVLALNHHNLFLEQITRGDVAEALVSQGATAEEMRQSRRFAELAIWKLKEMVALSGEATAAASLALEAAGDSARINLVLFSLFGIIIPLVAGILFARRVILIPLKSLLETARRLGEGDLSRRATVYTRDEIAVLAQTFNTMAGNLASYTAELESRVATRTKELEERVGINKLQLIELTRLNEELNKSTGLLIRRDLELSRASERLQNLDRAKSEFVSVAAHQLRTPLSAVKWALRMLIDGDAGEIGNDQKSVLMRAYESNERMIQLVNDLLDVDHIESGKFTYHFVPLNLRDVVESVLLEVIPLTYKKDIKIKLEAPENLPKISGDPEKMRMVVQNLLDNAVRYTMSGGVVIIRLKMEGKEVISEIEDTGIGIPAGQQGSVFKKFFRGSNAMKLVTDGSGLGLFIVQEILQKHGGKVSFKSTEGKGTIFTFSIPSSS